MKYRYKIEPIYGETKKENRWLVIDKQTNETKQDCSTRNEARQVANALNADAAPSKAA
jgi:hypothetical protein